MQRPRGGGRPGIFQEQLGEQCGCSRMNTGEYVRKDTERALGANSNYKDLCWLLL